MSLRILFADDSMTAQNMGKKILTEAGYEVVAVSNGAAAVKKIAEHKPDIIILDIYMPGYSGLEVCDKVRASRDTLRTPVLLTVGKMEPYKAEDANRVRADGVIIKPFEASDLLAVIKKLEERVVPQRTPVGEETVLLERPPDFAEFTLPPPENHRQNHVEAAENTVQSTVDVPDNMATTAAFSDLLGTDSGHSLEPLPMPREAFSSEIPVPVEATPEPEAVVERFSASSVAEEKTSDSGANGAAVSAPETQVSVEPSFAAIPDTEPIPVYKEPEPVVEATQAPAEPERAAAAASAETASPQATASPTETASFIDPGLAIHVARFDPFTAKVDEEVQKIEAIVSASEARHQDVEVRSVGSENGFEPSSHAAESARPADADFEARVAAAMSVYDQPVEEKEGPTETKAEISELHSFEYSPPVKTPVVEVPVETGAAEKTVAEIAQAVAEKPADFAPVPEAPVAAEEAPLRVAPMIMSAEATQVIPVYLEPPAEPVQPQPVAESPISVGPVLVTSEPTQVIPVYLEPAAKAVEGPAEPVQPEPVAEAPISVGPVLVTSEPTQVIPVYLEPAVTSAEPEPVPEAPTNIVASEPPAVAEVPPVLPETSQTMEERIAADVKAELPAVAVSAGVDTVMIHAVVDRILDRLKPQLIEEISRELKTKKK